ncbi:DUF1365 domain-containing protein [soil metagenome]
MTTALAPSSELATPDPDLTPGDERATIDPVDPRTGLRSVLYEGMVHHGRFAEADPVDPAGAVTHAFSYRVLMAWLALEELPGALDAHPLWSARRPAPVRFRRSDFGGPTAIGLDDAVRHTVAHHSGRRPTGPIRLLAHLRTWGWSFNPIVFYVVLTPDRRAIDTLVAEVTNTPWHERHAYVLPVGDTALTEPRRFAKQLHVSPFMDLDLDHSLTFGRPGGDHLAVGMDDWRGPHRTFAAALDLQRQSLDRRTMGAALRRHPLPAHRVSAGIYREALKLRLKGAPFRRHPRHTDPAPSPSSPSGCPIARASRSLP